MVALVFSYVYVALGNAPSSYHLQWKVYVVDARLGATVLVN